MIKQPDPAKIYDKLCNGDKLTGIELVVGIAFFKNLGDTALRGGPVFRLAAVEARRCEQRLTDYQIARQR